MSVGHESWDTAVPGRSGPVVGAGAVDADREFYGSSFPKLSSFDPGDATRFGATIDEVLTVPVRRLDTLCARFPPPDHVKIDVEGHAPAVLAGAERTIERHEPLLYVEAHDRPSAVRSEAVLDWCREHGYNVTEHDGVFHCRPAAES